MNIAVIGAGIMGLSAARALVDAGHRVTIFEQKAMPNPAASSYDDHRLIRFPYGDKVRYMEMVRAAYAAWDDLWIDLGRSFYRETGTLVLGVNAESWAAHSRNHLKQQSFAFTDLSTDRLAERYPYIQVEDIKVSFLLSSGGLLEARNILNALKVFLHSKGVEIFEHRHVSSLEPHNATFKANGTSHSYDRCITTAGPWLGALIEAFSVEVTPSRQTVVYLTPPAAHLERWQSAPMMLDIDHTSGFYLVPPRPGTRLKIGDHRFTLMGDPEDHHPATSEEIQNILHAACHRIPCLESYQVQDAPVRYYTVSKDERFIARRVGKTWVLTGFSGHGFKFGPLIGNRLAETIAGQYTDDAFTNWMAGH